MVGLAYFCATGKEGLSSGVIALSFG